MIYATPETEHGERSVRLIHTNEEIGIISNEGSEYGIILNEGSEYVFYAHDTTPLTIDLLECIINFLRTLNV